MSTPHFGNTYGTNASENYERFFVPSIGAPLADDLVDRAALRPGERVLDVACGTGVIARRASERVGAQGRVAGLDVNPGMLAVARSTAPSDVPIDWYEASAEAMPLPDEAFDAAICQLSLQFVPDKVAALREMRRVLVPNGRALLNVPGPMPDLFEVLADAMGRHVGAHAAGFVRHVFSLYETDEIQRLFEEAGFRDIDVRTEVKTLQLPPPREFLWQYVHSTPLGGLVAQVDDEARDALERAVVDQWRELEDGGALRGQQPITVAAGRK